MSKKHEHDFAQDKNVGPRVLKIKIVSKDVVEAQKKQQREERKAEAASKKLVIKFGSSVITSGSSGISRREEEPPPPPQPPPRVKSEAEIRREQQRQARAEARQKQLQETREAAKRIMEEEAKAARKSGGRRISQRRKRTAAAAGGDSDSDYVPNEGPGEDLADVDGMLSEDEEISTDDDDRSGAPRERATRMKRRVKIKIRQPRAETLAVLQQRSMEVASRMDACSCKGPVPLLELAIRSFVTNMEDSMRDRLMHINFQRPVPPVPPVLVMRRSAAAEHPDNPDVILRIVRDLCMLNRMDDTMLGILAERMQTLPFEILDLSGSRKVSAMGLQTFLQFQSARQLKGLFLTGCSEIVNDELIALVAASCPNLAQLSVGKCFKVQSLEPLQALQELEGLDVSWCHYVTDRQIELVLQSCRKLIRLSVAYCKRLTVQPFASLNTRCSALELSGLPLLGSEHVQWIGAHVCGPSLAFLYIEDCPSLNLALLSAICDHCKNLRSLSLARPAADETFQEEARKSFVRIAELQGLKELNLRQCQFVGNSAVIGIAKSCKGLESLDLSNCPRMQDSALDALAANCRALRKVNLSWCRSLSVAAVRGLATACKELVALELWGLERPLIAAIRSEFPLTAVRG